jgi:hypothetical protein
MYCMTYQLTLTFNILALVGQWFSSCPNHFQFEKITMMLLGQE